MESPLKLFCLETLDVYYDGGSSWVDLTIETCEEDALLYFVTNNTHVMMDDYFVKWNILRYAYKHQEDVPKISFDISNVTYHDYKQNLTKEEKIVLSNWVLFQWSMDPDSFDLENLFGDYDTGEICTPFYEQFKRLPREKQIELGKFGIVGKYYIECVSIDSINGMEKFIQQAVQPYKDEIKKMQLGALKAVRSDIPKEIVNICIGKHL